MGNRDTTGKLDPRVSTALKVWYGTDWTKTPLADEMYERGVRGDIARKLP